MKNTQMFLVHFQDSVYIVYTISIFSCLFSVLRQIWLKNGRKWSICSGGNYVSPHPGAADKK